MKKNLLYSLVAAGSLLVGGLTAYAVSETVQLVPRQATLDASGWIVTPENGGSTANLPNTGNPVCQKFRFTIDGIEVDDWDRGKVSVKYAGATVPFSSYAHMEAEDGDDLSDYYGWSFAPTSDYDGVEVRVNYQVFKDPGTIEITLKEGAFVTFDGDSSPALTYTHTFGGGGEVPEVPVQVAVKSCKPAAEATVQTLSNVTLRFDIDKLGDNQIFCDDSKADLITLTKAGNAEQIKATAVAFNESMEAYEINTIPYTITFPEVTEAGEYTMTVPAGFFWAAVEMGDKPADAVTNDEITIKYTVDPNALKGIQVYEIYSPAQSPEVLDKLDNVIIKFPDVNEQIHFTDDAKVYVMKDGNPVSGLKASLSNCWEFGDMHTAQVTFEKGDDTSYVITESGTYEITIPAGTIYLGEGEDKCGLITATFIVQSETKGYTWTATPENNGKIDLPTNKDGYTQFTFKINGAEEVSYDEWEDPNHDPIYGTTAKSIQVTYNGESVKNVANVAAGGESNIGYSLRSNWEEPEIVIGVSNQVFTKGGVLAITIDEGRCTADGNYPTPGIRYTCTIGEIQTTKDYEVKVSPAMDITQEYLIDYFKDGFKIEFTNAETVVPNMVKDYDDNDKPIMVLANPPHLKIGGVIYFGTVNVDEVKDAECPTFIITYPEMFDIDTTLGGYINFSVDEGTFTVDGEYDSPAISQTWRLERTKQVDTSYTFGPLGDIVNEGYGLYTMISFSGDEYISLDRSNIVVKFNEEVLTTSDYALTVMNGDNKCLYFQFENGKFTDPELTGAITVEIPANAISVSGVKIEEPINHTWNIVLPKSFTYKATGFTGKYTNGPTYHYKDNKDMTTDLPEASDLSEIIFEIPDAKTAQLWNKTFINLRSRDYMTYGAHMPDEVEEVIGAEHPTFKLKFNDAPTEETIYELSLNYSAFYVDNAYMTPNLEFAVNFKKGSGVNEIGTATDAKYTVVSVDGKVILTNGTIDQVKALAKGLYIINGKKQIIK